MESPIPSSLDLQLEARGLVSISVTVTVSEEEVKEEEAKRWRGGRQHVNEPAQCHWAPHRTAIWRIKDSYHLAASPTLYPHRIRINQIVLCRSAPWPSAETQKSGETALKELRLSEVMNTVRTRWQWEDRVVTRWNQTLKRTRAHSADYVIVFKSLSHLLGKALGCTFEHDLTSSPFSIFSLFTHFYHISIWQFHIKYKLTDNRQSLFTALCAEWIARSERRSSTIKGSSRNLWL